MITPMSRVVVACTAKSKEETLHALREWGCLHILPLQTPENENVSVAKAALTTAQKALDALPTKTSGVATAGSPQQGRDIISDINFVLAIKKTAEDTLTASKAELKRVEAFGEFNPHKIRKLRKRGFFVKLYSAEEKLFKPSDNLDFALEEFSRTNGEVCFAVFGLKNIDLPYTEIALPSKSVAELKEDCDKALKSIDECERDLAAYAQRRAEAASLIKEKESDLAVQTASAGMKSEKIGTTATLGIAFIQGYCPKSKLSSLQEFAAKNGWGITDEEPAADEQVPTLLKHSKAVKPIDALYGVLGITPGYREIDISSVFLTFFSIFFAMIVGDVVYGLLFAGITFFVSKKLKNAPRYPFQFLYLMSFCTIFWGFLNASYLGLNKLEGEVMLVPAFIDIVRASWSPDWLKSLGAWVRDEDNTKLICFCLAIVHLTIAHIWNAWVHRDEKATAISQVGWLCTTWLMFFLVKNMILGDVLPQPAIYAGVVGVVFILTGAIMKADWINVGMLPLNLVSNLVDVISYIRLFAVGMAGYAVANAFNGMLAPMFDSPIGAIGAALILLLVHALNIALAAMGVAVHAVRLNTLEFSNNVGVEWSGSAYTPFKKD
ncbi:V-type ATP synthase subunit I [Fibrobacterales bacterium]|nr:V-type ATP synthase subunit I [Fibrobacterales bacterium]